MWGDIVIHCLYLFYETVLLENGSSAQGYIDSVHQKSLH